MTRPTGAAESESCDLPARGAPQGKPCFRDRVDAGRCLAQALQRYRGRSALVLGLPRGGVEVASEVARALHADLDVLVVRKIAAPGDEEFALGAVSADGERVLDQEALRRARVSEAWLQAEIRRCVEQCVRREEYLRVHRPARPLRGRIVLVVDDGVATGATMRAALAVARKHGPLELVAAVPVGPRTIHGDLAGAADEVVCLLQPEPFLAVGRHYERYESIPEERVRELLEAAHPSPRE